jgi:hypothetical protein
MVSHPCARGSLQEMARCDGVDVRRAIFLRPEGPFRWSVQNH